MKCSIRNVSIFVNVALISSEIGYHFGTIVGCVIGFTIGVLGGLFLE